jgi:four helix bundle protein
MCRIKYHAYPKKRTIWLCQQVASSKWGVVALIRKVFSYLENKKMLELSHKKLIAWQKAIQLLPPIYELSKKLPKEETYNLIGQMKRAGLSVSNNIAEGASRKTKPDKKRFFEIARSSVVEVDNCITASLVLNFLTNEDVTGINSAIVELFKLISGLIDSNA